MLSLFKTIFKVGDAKKAYSPGEAHPADQVPQLLIDHDFLEDATQKDLEPFGVRLTSDAVRTPVSSLGAEQINTPSSTAMDEAAVEHSESMTPAPDRCGDEPGLIQGSEGSVEVPSVGLECDSAANPADQVPAPYKPFSMRTRGSDWVLPEPAPKAAGKLQSGAPKRRTPK